MRQYIELMNATPEDRAIFRENLFFKLPPQEFSAAIELQSYESLTALLESLKKLLLKNPQSKQVDTLLYCAKQIHKKIIEREIIELLQKDKTFMEKYPKGASKLAFVIAEQGYQPLQNWTASGDSPMELAAKILPSEKYGQIHHHFPSVAPQQTLLAYTLQTKRIATEIPQYSALPNSEARLNFRTTLMAAENRRKILENQTDESLQKLFESFKTILSIHTHLSQTDQTLVQQTMIAIRKEIVTRDIISILQNDNDFSDRFKQDTPWVADLIADHGALGVTHYSNERDIPVAVAIKALQGKYTNIDYYNELFPQAETASSKLKLK